jgi:hypothetical protein
MLINMTLMTLSIHGEKALDNTKNHLLFLKNPTSKDLRDAS